MRPSPKPLRPPRLAVEVPEAHSFSRSCVVSPGMTPRSRPRSHGIQPSLHARRVLSNLVAGPKGYVTEEHLARNALILSKVIPEPLKLVVDVGCGYGALATAIAVLTEARVVGFDVLEGRVRAVRDRPEAKDRVHVGIANVEAGLPIRKGVADLVIASEIIEHLYEPATLFEEASRVLRGGGRLVLTTPKSPALPYPAPPGPPKRPPEPRPPRGRFPKSPP